MQMKPITFDNITYNSALCAFQTRAHITVDATEYSFPVEVCAPLDVPPLLLLRRLRETARKMYEQRSKSLHTHRSLNDTGDFPLHAMAA